MATTTKKEKSKKSAKFNVHTLPSDKRNKKLIKDSKLGLNFINIIRPVSYVWRASNGKKHERKHYGFIAQEIEAALTTIGVETKDFAGLIIDEETGNYGLRYSEFIAPIVKSIQELSDENTSLRNRVDELENDIAEIKALLKK